MSREPNGRPHSREALKYWNQQTDLTMMEILTREELFTLTYSSVLWSLSIGVT